MTQRQIKKKNNAGQEKRLIFQISFNHSYRNGKNQREKYRQDMSVNLSENIPQQQKQ